jgi:hypothetical protein
MFALLSVLLPTPNAQYIVVLVVVHFVIIFFGRRNIFDEKVGFCLLRRRAIGGGA